MTTKFSQWMCESITFKLSIIGFFDCTLAYSVGGTITRRKSPIPIKPSPKKELKKRLEYVHFLPAKLDIKATVNPSIRYRSIYKVVVYNALINIEGYFEQPDFSQWKIESKDILYNLATLSFGIGDLRGVEERIALEQESNRLKSLVLSKAVLV